MASIDLGRHRVSLQRRRVSHHRKARRLVPRLLDWYAVNARDLPWRRTGNPIDPYPIWVSEIMLQQTQVATVIPYWKRWMRALPTIEKLARAKPERVLKLWEGLGYYSRARNLQAAAKEIVARHDGCFPKDPEAIRALPGIGRYTAGAIGSIAFGRAEPIVDGNVTRILTRIFGIRENPKDKLTQEHLWQLAEMLVVGTDNCAALNQSLMELGATVCTPRQPDCVNCPVSRACVARREKAIDAIPAKGRPIDYEVKRIDVYLITRGQRYLVQQRGEGGVNAGFWEFPNSENGARYSIPKNARPIATARHTITRYRIELKAYSIRSSRSQGKWCALNELRKLPFTAGHRKLLTKLQ
jgi:A/G-specific adenine glycosylase